MKRAKPHRAGAVEPTGAAAAVRPKEPVAAAEVDGINAAIDDLQPRMPRIDVRIGEGDVAGVVAADESERLLERTLCEYAAIREPDPEIQRAGRAARLGEPSDQWVVHDRRTPTTPRNGANANRRWIVMPVQFTL